MRRQSLQSARVGWIALGIAVLASSTHSSFAKELLSVLSPLSLLFLAEALTAFFVLLSFGVLPTLREIARLERKYFVPLLALGIFNGIIAPAILFTGLRQTTAINAELFGRSEMVAMIIFAMLFLREEHFTRAHAIGGSLIVFGTIFIALRGFHEELLIARGDLLILLATATYAVGSTIFKRYLFEVPPQLVIMGRSTVALLLFTLLNPFFEHPLREELRAFPFEFLPALLGFGFIARFLNLFSFYEAVDHLPVSTVSLALSLNIIGGTTFAALYLGEHFAWYHMIGGAFIVLGTMLLQILGMHPSEKDLEKHIRQHHRHHL